MYFKYLLISFLSLVVVGCPWKITVPPETTSDEWIAIVDIDGSNLEFIIESSATPYFVPDFENPEEELILINYSNRIDLIKLDGTDRRTIIDSVGSVFNFSQDKSKMLLNCEGEIYIANVDGTELRNLTNTPDIWEVDPSFSINADKIVFSYSLQNNTHAFLITKDLTTNQDSIIYDYQIRNSYQNLQFRNPAFQNDLHVLYRFYLIDQTEEPYVYRYELHRFNIDTGVNEIITDMFEVYSLVYNSTINKCLIKTEGFTFLFNLTNFETEHDFNDSNISTVTRFSSNANYASIGHQIFDLNTNFEYSIDTEDNDFNQTETKIVGIADRIYPED